MTTLNLREDQITHLAGLLAGVASADGDFDVFEAGEIGDILTDICPGHEIPLEASRLIANFEKVDFSVEEACAALNLQTQAERDAVLTLMMRVVHADDIPDIRENAYVTKVADLLGAHFEEIDMDDVIEIVTPPPIPE
jgi:uncharacterized tellurite resistance protein B-like protein